MNNTTDLNSTDEVISLLRKIFFCFLLVHALAGGLTLLVINLPEFAESYPVVKTSANMIIIFVLILMVSLFFLTHIFRNAVCYLAHGVVVCLILVKSVFSCKNVMAQPLI